MRRENDAGAMQLEQGWPMGTKGQGSGAALKEA